ncbi:unnamed protein product [Rotaria sp. Silwood1]|nr:unnamed protein product [Rotaria sp. Silwood1]
MKGWTIDPTQSIILTYSTVPTIQFRLPAGDSNTSLIHIFARIRDTLNCITEYKLSEITNNPIVQILNSGNQNAISQIISSLSQEFNEINFETIENIIANGIPMSNIVVLGLYSEVQQVSSVSYNASALIEYNKQINIYANARDYLITFTTNLVVTNVNSIKLQASSLAQLTQSTNQITRTDSAINGLLQQRTSRLDLDSSRANNFPSDYDTDLEFEWPNPNIIFSIDFNLKKKQFNFINIDLFVDGNDFSWETIEKNQNLYYQKQTANKISIQTDETISIESLSNKSIQQIIIQYHFSILQPLASFGNSHSQSNTNLSRLISLSLLDNNKNEISIRTNFNHPIELIIVRDVNFILPSMTLQNVISFNLTSHNQLFNLHFINITSNFSISIHIEIYPLNTNISYLCIYKFDSTPLLNSSINQIDSWTLFCPISKFVSLIIKKQSIIFGLRELNSTEFINYCSNSSINSPPITNERFNFTANYERRIYTSACYYLDSNNNWQSDGLLVGSLTKHYQTQCFSTYLTTFASGFIVLPAPINWNYVFANVDFMKNKTVYLTIICIFLLYILLIIYARYKDKKDLEKLGVTPLSDNHQFDQYFYRIIVFTGHRKNARTKSTVYFILSGNDNETQIRTLADPHRTILQRGGIDAFIMAVPKSLGSLNYIHIWHDNIGSSTSASWFLKYIIVRDLQTMEKFYFICQKWLAVEKEDGFIERILPLADEYQKQEFSYVLSKQAYHSISEGHLWFSIFSPPSPNKFTRVQRCTCCFVLLLTAMFLNILYYDQIKEAHTQISTNNDQQAVEFIDEDHVKLNDDEDYLHSIEVCICINYSIINNNSNNLLSSFYFGRYVYEFRGRLNYLRNNLLQFHQLNWIDSQTRAIIIQFTLYNSNSQLFISINLLTEFLSTGGIKSQSRFEPISFQEIQSLIKLKIVYFRNVWSFINLGIISCSWTNIGIYIWRYRE